MLLRNAWAEIDLNAIAHNIKEGKKKINEGTKLCAVVKADALSGFEIRFINQLALKDATKLPQKITAEYLARIILTQNRVDDSEETLILSEELRK